jgi:large subunit ribosomal protein L24
MKVVIMNKLVSVKPRKQRKLLYKGDKRLRHKLLGASLSDKLREKYGVRTIPVKNGDTVRISRGDFSGIEGKVTEVNTEKGRLIIEGVTREQVSGTSTKVPIHASKVEVINLNTSDKWRMRKLEKGKNQSEAKKDSNEKSKNQ